MKARIKIHKTEYLCLDRVDFPVEVEAEVDSSISYRVQSEELERIGADGFLGRDGGLLLLNHPNYDEIEFLGYINESELIYVHTYQHASGLNQKTRVTVYKDEEEAKAQCLLLGGTVKKYREVIDESQS